MSGLCEAVLMPATNYDPAVLCDDEALPDSTFCYAHDPDGYEADHAEEIALARVRGE